MHRLLNRRGTNLWNRTLLMLLHLRLRPRTGWPVRRRQRRPFARRVPLSTTPTPTRAMSPPPPAVLPRQQPHNHLAESLSLDQLRTRSLCQRPRSINNQLLDRPSRHPRLLFLPLVHLRHPSLALNRLRRLSQRKSRSRTWLLDLFVHLAMVLTSLASGECAIGPYIYFYFWIYLYY